MKIEVNGLRMFIKGDTAYCLIASNNLPNLLIPTKCKIIDIEYNDEVNPYYVVQVIKFYDNFQFINEFFINKNFYYARRSSKKDRVVKDRSSPNKLRMYKNIDNLDDVYNILQGIGTFKVQNNKDIHDGSFEAKERHYLATEALFAFKTKTEMMQVYEQMHEFYIFQILRQLKTYVTRKSYKGKFKFSSESEFEISLQKMFVEGCEAMNINQWKKLKNSI